MLRTTGTVAPIAIVGLACRVPGADGAGKLWENLCAGVDGVAVPSALRSTAAVPTGPGLPEEGGFLDSVAEFDADFFGVSAREAVAMDPQQRLALELAWESLEDAGIVPDVLCSQPVGVFIGSLSDDYALLNSGQGPHVLSHHAMTGLERGVIANRVSHHLGVRGPSLVVDTGQSSSLVSVHMACTSLREGECELALAGGVNLALAPDTQLTAARMGVLSRSGRCRVLDRDADGFVRGEGGGLVVLKPLEAALADGDRVYCVIRASSVNHDGAGKEMAAPDGKAQAELLRATHRRAGVDPEDVQYVELHGTGTPSGDETEARALGEVFAGRSTGHVAVGSVKTNIGHLEGAAGVVGLIKTALALHHRTLPPSLHFTAPPDHLPLTDLGLRVQTQTSGWALPEKPLVAGVSSFGMGGTNCHAVLGAAPEAEPVPRPETAGLLPYVLSAHTPQALARAAHDLGAHLRTRPELRGEDVAFTLATARTAHAHRAVVVAGERAALLSRLEGLEGLGEAVKPELPSHLREPVRRFLDGERVDWTEVFADRAPARVGLTTYPFQRRRYWPDSLPVATARETGPSAPGAGSDGDPLETVLDLVSRTLGRAAVPDTPFSEQGLDSVAALELRDLVEEQTGVDLPASLVYDYPTPTELAEHLADRVAVDNPHTSTQSRTSPETDPVVIVGMGCRFPGGVETPDDLWRLLLEGREAITDPPATRGWHRLETEGLCPGGFLEGIDLFDAEFFGISPREAAAMEPQQRLFLEVVWEAIENAGIVPRSLNGTRTAMFAGATAQDYGVRLHERAETAGGFLLTGSTSSVLSGRVAYVLGLGGPALTVDTACSSSLSALHMACRSLRTGESTLAVAGGVTVMPLPGMFTEFARQGGLSPEGRCRAFSASADGTGWAEGAGALVLERLSDARRNGHPVLARVRGSALNSDGASNGLTAPSGPAQQRVIADALADAGLDPDEVDAVEAHGTGTVLGDPIEANALTAAYARGRPADRPLLLGSVKSNIGHTQAAAGVAGVIKMVLALRHGELPSTLHADDRSPHIDWSSGVLELLTEAAPWPRTRRLRRAGVSSFGISGTNAHVILEQAPEPDEPGPTPAQGPTVLALSGHSELALRAQATRLREDWMRNSWSASDIAYSLLHTRTRFRCRAAVVGTDHDTLMRGLAAVAEGTADPAVITGTVVERQRPVFVFAGQGAQWTGMARRLLDSSSEFFESVARCERALDPYVDWSLTGVLRDEEGQPGLDRVDVVQPVLFSIMVALARLWQAHGIEPAAVIGHSQGEIAAAHVSGALSLDDAARVVALRARALAALAGRGAMASIALGADDVRSLLAEWDGAVTTAAHNGPEATTVSGESDAVTAFVERCVADGVRAKLVAVDYASHSVQVESLRESLLTDLAGVQPRVPAVPLMSTVDVAKVRDEGLDAGYWYRNLREVVRFDEAVGALIASGHHTFVEVGPHPILLSGIAERADASETPVVLLESLTRGEGGTERFLRSLAKADAHGLPVDWSRAVWGRAVPLPTYPFQRKPHWLPAPAASVDLGAMGLAAATHPFLGASVEIADTGGVLLTGSVSLESAPWLADHAVFDTVVLPGTACLDLVLRAGRLLDCPSAVELVLDTPVVLPEEETLTLQVAVGAPDDRGCRTMTLYSRNEGRGGDWTRHATALVEPDTPMSTDRIDRWPPREATPVPVAGHYDRLREIGLDYGPAHQGLRAAWTVGEDVWLDVVLPEGEAGAFGIHPALLDAALHGIWLRLDDEGECELPFSWTGVRVRENAATALRVRLTPAAEDDGVALTAWDEDGEPVIEVDHLALRRVSPEAFTGAAGLFSLDWARISPETTAGPVDPPVVVGTELPERAPATAVLLCQAGQEPTTAAARVLETVRTWVNDERFALSRLVVLTTGGDGELSDPGHAAVWGLVRSAQAEHPDRFVLLDTGTETGPAARAAEAVALGEAQLRYREGRYSTPVVRRLPAAAQRETVTLGGTALITGGTGGIGALVARRLVESHGVRRVLLLSRRGPASPGADRLVRELAGLGAEAEVVACDAADRTALRDVCSTVPEEEPLTTVIHAAGVLDDGLVSGMDHASLARVMWPKADAALALHELTANIPTVSAFVLFSSVAGLFGTAGQANYAAANGALDALARCRRAEGLPAVSIAWGLWEQRSGMTDQLDETALRRLAETGIGRLDTGTGLELLDSALAVSAPVVVGARLHVRGSSSLLRGIAPSRPRRESRPSPDRAVAEELAGLTPGQRRKRMIGIVSGHTAAVLGHDTPDELDASTSFRELGCDSLIAVEVRNRLAALTGLHLPATVVFSHPTPEQLAAYLVDRLVPAEHPESDAPATSAVDSVAETEAEGPPGASAHTDGEEIDHILNRAEVAELFELIDTEPDLGGVGAAVSKGGQADG